MAVAPLLLGSSSVKPPRVRRTRRWKAG